MQLEKLTISDFGLFNGRQVFDLTPRVRDGAKRPIILFGGLNGSGKTTFLTAVRLALYGRSSVDAGATQKQYEALLDDLIHRPRNSSVRATSASISLEFTYARLGKRVSYRVLRSWEARSQGVEESLSVFQNDEVDEVLAGEQAQAFLNQLIPTGISQFFFFDGEKIAALARDDSDVVLADAIRRLLGLDLADRLGGDLTVFLRQKRSETANKDAQARVAAIETQLTSLEAETQADMKHLEFDLEPSLDKAKQDYEQRKAELMDRGGAWAVNRGDLEGRLDRLRMDRQVLEDQLREQLSGIAIFTLAPKLCSKVVLALEASQVLSEQRTLAKVVLEQASVLKARLSTMDKLKGEQRVIAACIDSWAAELTSMPKILPEIDYGLSDAEARNAIVSMSITAPSAQRELASTFRVLENAVRDEDSILEKLAHAPSEDSIRDAFDSLTLAAAEVALYQETRKQFIEEMRRKIWMQIDLTRQLKKLISQVEDIVVDSRGEDIAESLQDMIAEYKGASSEEKCKSLRRHFIAAFSRLARKGDVVHNAVISSTDYKVTLLDREGREIPKKRLSAGEKQIYAIAMLEALAKASGRHLPIIIDTPLGRLDSAHRQKLVESYFPVASHQVIVLSTDTEIDRSFYDGLQPHLSHGYHLSFDEAAGATTAREGYFWKRTNGGNVHAS
jgi:DNA sulfur modification protein DndD